MKRALAALVALASGVVLAQSVALQGMLGNKALLIIDGAPPKSVAPGETHKGVKVLSTMGDQAVLEYGGKRHTLRVGDAPGSVGSAGASAAAGTRIVLAAGSGGHFMAQGQINGRQVVFMVDTGATAIGIGQREAERLGLDYRAGRPVAMGTANGTVQAWQLRLASVRIGDVEVFDVEAVVVPAAMPYALLGNSFLSRFQMQRNNEQMVLERRY